MQTLTFTCANCDASVVSGPVFHLGLAFCCAGCAADGPCSCSYDAPGAERAAAGRHVVIAGDAGADAEIALAGLQGAVVEPPALSAATIAERPAARSSSVGIPAAPASAPAPRDGQLVASRGA